MKISIITLGCKVNQYESDVLAEGLRHQGHEISTKLEEADIFILNSCAVTNEAERKSRQYIAKFNKLNPNCKIFVMGCASQNNRNQFADMKNVKLVLGNTGKTKVLESLEKRGKKLEPLPLVYENISLSTSSHTRAYVKIQDGCDRFCAYCLIPHIRGRSRSRDIVSILTEIDALMHNDVKEIVLTGIDVSDYKIDDEPALDQLVEQLADYKVRLRFSSMEVNLITDKFLIALKKLHSFCPHFHLSMQSGSTSVLKRMNRRYSSEQFIKAVKKIRHYFPDASITTDVIVGFPGETEKEFKQTMRTVRKVKFAYMHIFPYSRRSGTTADKLIDSKHHPEFHLLAPEVIKARSKTLANLNQKQSKRFRKTQLESVKKVLIEEKKGEFYIGHTENFIKIYIPETNKIRENEIYPVKLISLYNDGVIAEIVHA